MGLTTIVFIAAATLTQLQTEVAQLKKENAHLREGIEVLAEGQNPMPQYIKSARYQLALPDVGRVTRKQLRDAYAARRKHYRSHPDPDIERTSLQEIRTAYWAIYAFEGFAGDR